jgi:exodeoxyribonuclease V alpha subunit
MAEGTDKIKGTITGIVFHNSENGYTVLRLKDDDDETVTAVGCIPGAAEGERIELTGAWMTHPSYGLQFKASSFTHLLPRTVTEIYGYLASGGIKGVGAATAKNIVAMFGEDTFEIMELHPERLSEVKGISPKKARDIGRSFRERTGMRALTEFLNEYGLNPAFAVRLYNCFGDNAMEAVARRSIILIGSYIRRDLQGGGQARHGAGDRRQLTDPRPRSHTVHAEAGRGSGQRLPPGAAAYRHGVKQDEHTRRGSEAGHRLS